MSLRGTVTFFYSFLRGGPAQKITAHLLLAQKCKKKGHLRLARYLHKRIQQYGVFISEKSCLAQDIKFPHPIGIVIGEGVIIGNKVKIFQNVTLGGARIGDGIEGNYPRIGNNVVIFAGAVIIGSISIGDNSIIGANSVVIKDVPANSTCVGAPGRIIQKNN